MNEGKTVADYLGTMCRGPLPRSILEKYAQEPGFHGLVFCDRCWGMQPISKETADVLIGLAEDKEFHFNPLTDYYVTSCCPACEGENETVRAGFAKAVDYPQKTVFL